MVKYLKIPYPIDKLDLKRFEKRIDKTPGHGPWGDCHLWIGAKNKRGYGNFVIKGKTYKAHRVAYTIHRKRSPKHIFEMLHKCDNTSCVNPKHLHAAKHKVNMRDSIKKGRSGAQVDPKVFAKKISKGQKLRYNVRPESFVKGENHGRAKLTIIEVIKIRKKYKTGTYSLTKLANKYNVTVKNIALIVTNRTWNNLEKAA